MSLSSDADVAVIGGGPVGSVLATLLGRAGLRTIVLERGEYPRDKPCGEGLMPGGVRVLEDIGIDLAREGYPRLGGIRYRTLSGESAFGAFRPCGSAPDHGFGVRRRRFDQLLAERSAATPRVRVETSCEVSAITRSQDRLAIETTRGSLKVEMVIGADGLRSRTRTLMGWSLPPSPPHRHALVSHLAVPGHAVRDVIVTLTGSNEVYVAPSGDDEVLAVVLGSPGTLRLPGLSVAETYSRAVFAAHPEFIGAAFEPIHGAGPFRVRARTVAESGVFLVGDAAGFVDPVTGDAMTAGFQAAARLARLLTGDPAAAASEYRRWFRSQWRTRRVVSSIALKLTGSPPLAHRALKGMARRPGALESLLQVNSGTRPLGSVPWRDWSALAGI